MNTNEQIAREAAEKCPVKTNAAVDQCEVIILAAIEKAYRQGLNEGLDTDHINGDGLDNRRENIRVSTKSQNQANRRNLQSNNTSGFKGVDFHRGKWRAQIKVDGRKIDLGSFDTPDEASGAYLRSAHHHFGKFAYPPLKEGK